MNTELNKRLLDLEKRLDTLERKNEHTKRALKWMWTRVRRFHRHIPEGAPYELGTTLRIPGRPAILRMMGQGRDRDPMQEPDYAESLSDRAGVP